MDMNRKEIWPWIPPKGHVRCEEVSSLIMYRDHFTRTRLCEQITVLLAHFVWRSQTLKGIKSFNDKFQQENEDQRGMRFVLNYQRLVVHALSVEVLCIRVETVDPFPHFSIPFPRIDRTYLPI